MFQQIASDVKDSARATARAAALSTLGAVFALVGTGFLTVALWLLLVSLQTALFAATVIGALYCAVGFLFLAFGTSASATSSASEPEFSSGRSGAAPANEQREPFMQLAEGFAMGMKAGRSARQR
ncbi:MAG: phage holin family protein [Sedimentitalea sp.]|uniref:phage holin family protein n=1 Tax=Sedimentitalea sp. TaxID=2048915 RepID=UPI003263411E